MMFFVISPLFRRRRRRARDEMPLEPLVDYLLFWTFLGFGTLLVSAAGFAAFALFEGWLGATHLSATAAALALLAGLVALRVAFVWWPRIR